MHATGPNKYIENFKKMYYIAI